MKCRDSAAHKRQNGAAPSADERTEGQITSSDLNLTSTPARPSRSTRWKTLERTAARKLRGRRIHRRLFEKAPDVVVSDFRLVVEAKAYAKFAHHSLLDIAQGKYAEHGETVALVTKTKGQHGEFVTVPLDWLAAILDEVRIARGGAE